MKLILGLLAGILLAFNAPDIATHILHYASLGLNFIVDLVQGMA